MSKKTDFPLYGRAGRSPPGRPPSPGNMPPPPPVMMLVILLDNALKHSDGEIDVRAGQEGSRVQVSVGDHGAGIDPNVLPHVFDRIYRGEERSTVPGFGLGLPIAKALMDGMGGSIGIQSEPGEGSTVTVRFSAYWAEYIQRT